MPILSRSRKVLVIGSGILLLVLGGCSVFDHFREATKSECAMAAKHALILHAGEHGALGAGAVDLVLPGVIDKLLSPMVDVCIAAAMRSDYKCVMRSGSKRELRECEFYVDNWSGL